MRFANIIDVYCSNIYILIKYYYFIPSLFIFNLTKRIKYEKLDVQGNRVLDVWLIMYQNLFLFLYFSILINESWSYWKLTSIKGMESMPVGFRFHPTGEELVSHYLRLKMEGNDSQVHVIPEVNVCKWKPSDLPTMYCIILLTQLPKI